MPMTVSVADKYKAVEVGGKSVRRAAYFGGSFDPPHRGHFAIARSLIEKFGLDEFVFIPAFHAPHKPDRPPTPAIHRYAMLAIATNDDPRISVSTIEIDEPDKPYTFQTLERLNSTLRDTRIFFVMGADSWQDITTWRNWEAVLSAADHIVVTRPGFPISFGHIPEYLRDRIIDLRNGIDQDAGAISDSQSIFITDAVTVDASATEVRTDIENNDSQWRDQITDEVAKYIEKYELYK